MQAGPSEEILLQRRERQERLQLLCAELYQGLPASTSCVLEIGCGHGHFLAAFAETNPTLHCVGIDIVTKRIEKGNKKKENRNLENLHFIKAELTEFLDAVPDHVSFAQAFMLFPDPWPKKRHFKNRMIQPEFLSKLATMMPSGAHFHFRSDHEGYFEWTSEHLEAHQDWLCDASVAWPFEESSYFQEMMDRWQSLSAVRI